MADHRLKITSASNINSKNSTNNTNSTTSNYATGLDYNFHAGDTPIDIAKKNFQRIEIYQMLYDFEKTVANYVGEKDKRVDL